MQTYHIHITGLVQGVGFRPFVHQLAKKFNLHGWVNNASDGVHIEINATEKLAEEFYQAVVKNAPALSKITHHKIETTNSVVYSAFTINESEIAASAKLMLTPDFALCADCRKEMHDPVNRRYHYPFITCTNCGPRYSIINTLPYDRANTSMQSFTMCKDCNEEYNDSNYRRHYSQTNSCTACSISLNMFSNTGEKLCSGYTSVIAKIADALADEKIIAVKGIGGYLLLCDAASESVIKELRKRKHRPAKPFALLYPGIDAVKNDFYLSQQETNRLQTVAAPIVLLKQKATAIFSLPVTKIAPGLSSLGIMLPYAPLFELIAAAFKKPMIATSANIAGGSIIYTDEGAMQELLTVADYIVTNNRVIVIAQDDSVIKFTPLHQQQIIIRRSRGMAPSFFGYTTNSAENILAAGALLKSSFTCAINGNIYISQYLGNTDSYEAQQAYEKTVAHFVQLFNQQPAQILADKHPLYFATEFANKLSEQLNILPISIQHHKAHAAAVLAENNLLKNKDAVLCVIWDGTGLGDDNNIWGGEFFAFQNNALQRFNYFDYFPVIAGDKMAKEPRLSALAICSRVEGAKNILQNKFNETEWKLYNKLIETNPVILCSSAGRLFDAVASLLNLCNKQSYEGQAAMLLEETATVYFRQHGYKSVQSYFPDEQNENSISTTKLFAGIITDIKNGVTDDLIAAKFHYSLVTIIAAVADTLPTKVIACSGGVFQSSLMVDLLIELLGKRYQLHFHKQLSPNDENISFGQLVYFDNNIDDCKTLLNRT